MKQLNREDIKNLEFDGIIIGIPSYVEIDQHKDMIFKVAYFKMEDETIYYSIYYNADNLPNGLSFGGLEKNVEKLFKFDSYEYYKFDNLLEFCEWYIQRQDKIDYVPTEFSNTTVKIKRKDKLKEVREYVQQVLNIEYYKNFAVFNNEQSIAMKEFTQGMAEKLKEQLVNWLEEEV